MKIISHRDCVFRIFYGFVWVIFCCSVAVGGTEPCAIEVVEKGTGLPVPLVELRTLHQVRLVSDNAGMIAFDLPELLGKETWFEVIGHGYEVPSDGFGFRGVRIRPEAGGRIRVEVERTAIAKRIGRLTGGGLFAESQKINPASQEIESGVLGCDSVQTAVHKGKLYWLWGDTTLPGYPLGIFHGTSATTAVQPLKSWEPPLQMEYKYFTNEEGSPCGVAEMPGEGPTWVTGYISLPDEEGIPHLVGSYMKIKPPMEAYQWGLAVWHEEKHQFEQIKVIWTKTESNPSPPPVPEGHPVLWKDEAGKEWVLFGNPLPTLRCPATYEGWQDPSKWEVLNPQETIPVAGGEEEIKPHSGSIAWNPWRQCWVTVFMQWFGKPSAFGEVWYAESPSPMGPWGPAIKVLSHENYTFYNPRLHPEFTPRQSPMLFFEGTYSMQFADHAQATPRYDYNQVLYRLDLDDPRLRGIQDPP